VRLNVNRLPVTFLVLGLIFKTTLIVLFRFDYSPLVLR
jgi:hypothetical protein